MWKKINRHLRAGGTAGIVIPAIWSGYLLIEAPEWRTPAVLLLTVILGLIVGTGAGVIAMGIEKIVSRRLSLIPTVIAAVIVSLFITAVFTSAQ